MANVLTVEAKLNGDASGLVAATAKAAAGLTALEAAAKRAGKMGPAFDELGFRVGKALGGAIGFTGRFGLKVIDVTSKVISTLAKLTFRAALAGGAVATIFGGMAIKAGLDRMMSIQDATVALTRMLGSAEAAAKLTGKALDVVKGTPFAFPQFAEATRTLVAFGVKAEKIPNVLLAIADSAAASGRGAEAVNGITQAFANMAVTGKINSDIIQSLGTSGVNALGILANHFKVTTGEAQGMVSDGLIPAEEAMDILVNGIENGSKGIAGDFKALKGAAQDLGKTVSGSLGNVKAAFARMGASWLKPFEEDFPKVLNGGVIPLLDKVGDAGGRMMKKLADTGILQKLTDGFNSLIKYVDPATSSFLGIVKSLSPLGAIFSALRDVMPAITNAFEGVGRVAGEELVPAMADLFEAMIPLLPAFAELLSAGLKGMIEVMPALVVVVQALVAVAVPLLNVISGLPGPFLGVIGVLGTLQAAGIPVTGMLSALGEAIKGMLLKMVGLEAAGAAAEGGMTKSAGGMKTMVSALGPGTLGVIGAAAAVLGIFAAHAAEVSRETDIVRASLDKATGALTAQTRAAQVDALYKDGAIQAAQKLGIATDVLVDATMGDVKAQALIQEKYDAFSEKLKTASDDIGSINPKIAEQEGLWATMTSSLDEASASVAKSSAEDQIKARAMGVVKEATLTFRTAQEAATASVLANGKSLNVATVAGQKNSAALDAMGVSANAVTDAMIKEGRSNYDVEKSALRSREAFSLMAQSMGMGKTEADALAASIVKIPNEKKVKVGVSVTGMDLLDVLKSRIASISSKTVSLKAGVQTFGLAKGGVVKAMAAGGMAGVEHAATGRSPMIAKGGANIMWAEPETGWEAYISGNKKHKQRNQEVWMEAGRKLGMFDYIGSDRNAPARTGGGGDGSSAPVIVNINAPVITPNGTLVGMIRGVAGEQIEFRFAEETLKKGAGFRR